MHFDDNILRKSLYHKNLWLTVSDRQEWAAVCSLDRIYILRTLMYPNLYPDWPYLLYGDTVITQQTYPEDIRCTMSNDGHTLLWTARNQSGELRLHVLLHLERSKQILFRGHAPDLSGWKTVHARDGLRDAWGSIMIGGPAATAAALSSDGGWLVSLHCRASDGTGAGGESTAEASVLFRRLPTAADDNRAEVAENAEQSIIVDGRHCGPTAAIAFRGGAVLVAGGAALTTIELAPAPAGGWRGPPAPWAADR